MLYVYVYNADKALWWLYTGSREAAACRVATVLGIRNASAERTGLYVCYVLRTHNSILFTRGMCEYLCIYFCMM